MDYRDNKEKCDQQEEIIRELKEEKGKLLNLLSCESLYGNLSDIANLYIHLAEDYVQQGNKIEAEKEYNKALKICKRLFSIDSSDFSSLYASTLERLASLLSQDINKIDEAIEKYYNAKEVYEQMNQDERIVMKIKDIEIKIKSLINHFV